MGPDRDGMLRRIEGRVGVGDVVGGLERLGGADLRSLLLAVGRRRAARLTPPRLLARYRAEPSASPGAVDPRRLLEVERRALALLPAGFAPLALAPVAPFGATSVLTPVSQDAVATTTGGTEVVSDPTNVLALECAVRRSALLAAEPGTRERVRLAAAHRVLRLQRGEGPGGTHFALVALATAGRDEGGFRFEAEALVEHVAFHLALVDDLRRARAALGPARVALTDLEGGRRTEVLRRAVLEPLAAAFPTVAVALDPERRRGRGYYTDAAVRVSAATAAGPDTELADGGVVPWTAELLGDRKERLVISGIGSERLAAALPPDDG